MKRRLLTTLLTCTALALPACVTHSHSTEFNGVPGVRGEPVAYQSTSSYALHFLFAFGIAGDASKTNTIDQFTREASARGASRTRITQTSSSTYWYIFPPLSFFIHPVVHTVEGTVEGTGASE